MGEISMTFRMLITGGLVAVVIGLLLGVSLGYFFFRNRGSSQRRNESAPAAVYDEAAELMKGRAVQALRLWRDQTSGRLVAEMEGKIIPKVEDLTATQRQSLETMLREMVAWVRPARQAEAGEAPAPTAPPPAAVPEAVKPVPAAVPAPVVIPAVSVTTAAPEVRKPGSIVEQIDAILQEMLAVSPLADQRIRLVEDPRHGVVVYQGMQSFPGIDAVTDPAVKSLIRSAVQEWERRAESRTR